MRWGDDLLGPAIYIDGVPVEPRRKALNFLGGATAVDNPQTGRTDITVSGGGAQTTGVAGMQATTLDGPLAIGFIPFAPTAAGVLRLNAMLNTDSADATATLRLYNLDLGEPVTGALVTSTSVAPQSVVSGPLTVGSAAGNIRLGQHTYEVQLWRVGGSPSHVVRCYLAQINVSNS
jgi:hypothetical protein